MPFVKRSDLSRPLTSGEVDNNFSLAETLFYAGQAAGKVFENTTDGLAGTTDGQFFTVPDGAGGFSVYRNDAGSATLIGSADGPTGMANPMTAAGDIIVGGVSGAESRLAKGTDGQVLTLASGAPVWADAAGGSLFTTLTDKTANRAVYTTYTNTTGKPLGVYVNFEITIDARKIKAVVNGLTILTSAVFNNYDYPGIFFIVPPGATYSASYYSSSSGVALFSWFEVS